MGVAMALVLALSAWLQGSADADIADERPQREATLLANALSASLAGTTRRWPERAPRSAGRPACPAIQSVLVVAGRELLGIHARPKTRRRAAVQREEKPLFDLVGTLRAAGETNVGEGVVRKKTIQVDDKGDGVVTVSVPYRVDGQFAGLVQARVQPAARHGGGGGAGWALPPGAAGGGGRDRRVPAPSTRQRRVDVGRALAVVALLVLAIGYQQQRLGAMRARRWTRATPPSARCRRLRRR
jgi:hypothetical protein